MGESHMGLQARLMSQALRKLTAFTNKSNCTVVFINQLRETIGVTFGNPETTTGGRCLLYTSQIVCKRRFRQIILQNGFAENFRKRRGGSFTSVMGRYTEVGGRYFIKIFQCVYQRGFCLVGTHKFHFLKLNYYSVYHINEIN